MVDRCVICGAIVPEGTQVCEKCKHRYNGVQYETCYSCAWNDDEFCDRRGMFIHDDDKACRRWKAKK